MSSRKAIGIKGAATRKRISDARYKRLALAVRCLRVAARFAEASLRYPISNTHRANVRAELVSGLAAVDLVLPQDTEQP